MLSPGFCGCCTGSKVRGADFDNRAERENPFLGARFFFIAAGAAKNHIEFVIVKCLLQAFCFGDIDMQDRDMLERVDVFLNSTASGLV